MKKIYTNINHCSKCGAVALVKKETSKKWIAHCSQRRIINGCQQSASPEKTKENAIHSWNKINT